MMKYKIGIPTMEIKISSDKIFALLIGVMFCHYTIFDYFAVIIGKLPVISIFKSFFFPLLYAVLIFFSLKKSRFKWIGAADIGIVLFFVISILLTAVFYPNNTKYITAEMWTDIMPCLPFFLLGLCIDLDEDTYKTVGKMSCLAVVVNTLYLIYFLDSDRTLGGSHEEDYNMYWSYLLLPNTLFAIDYAFQSKKLLPTICSVIGVIYAFSMGTRGPIVVLAVCLVVCIWKNINLRTGGKIVIIAAIAGVVAAFVSSTLYMDTLESIRKALDEGGVSTRAVDYLISGEMISETSGRDDIYAVLLAKLSERPFLGYGVYGEYPLGYEAGAHNIYLQTVFNYGYPIGAVLIVSYIAVFVTALAKTKGLLIQRWIALFGCLVLVKGIFGGGYLDYQVFFLLAICLKSLREVKGINRWTRSIA